VLLPIEDLRELTQDILFPYGVPPDRAKIQTHLFLDAELRAIQATGFCASGARSSVSVLACWSRLSQAASIARRAVFSVWMENAAWDL
jgi:hypothetical protein